MPPRTVKQVIKRRAVQHESAEQRALIEWCGREARNHPELSLIFAIPNGGRRDARTGQMLKLEGVRAGVPDLMLPVARRNFHGLFIEMKHGKNKQTAAQLDWAVQLMRQGYHVALCYGWIEAKELIEAYLGLEDK